MTPEQAAGLTAACDDIQPVVEDGKTKHWQARLWRDSKHHWGTGPTLLEAVIAAHKEAGTNLSFLSASTSITKRERERLDRLKDRCHVLQVRIDEGLNPHKQDWQQELSALSWAVARIEGSADRQTNK